MMQYKYSKFFFVTLSLIVFISCKCETYGDGIVLDAETSEPLSEVVVKSYVDNSVPSYVSEMTTDSTGFYSGSTGKTRGGFSGCKDLLVEFHKNGYTILKAYNPNNETVYLSKIR